MKKHLRPDSTYRFTSYKTVSFTTSPAELVLNGFGYLFYCPLFSKVIMKKFEAWISFARWYQRFIFHDLLSYQTRTTVAYLCQNVKPRIGVDAIVRSAGVLLREYSDNIILASLIWKTKLRISQLYLTKATLMVTVQLFCILIKSSLTETTRGNLYIHLMVVIAADRVGEACRLCVVKIKASNQIKWQLFAPSEGPFGVKILAK